MKRFLQICLFIILIAALFFFSRQAKIDREWVEELSKMPKFSQTERGYHIKNLRQWDFRLAGPLTKQWSETHIYPNDLSAVWYFLEPFENNDMFAHTYLSFVFTTENGNSQTISVSVEARREDGENYSALRGIFRKFELLYVWSTEKDIHTKIAIHRDDQLYAYQLNLSKEHMIAIFEHFIKRTNDLKDNPRFYNTLFSNCTNELAKAVNDAFPKALPWNISWITTGRAAHWLIELGYIKPPNYDPNIQSLIKTHAGEPEQVFSKVWRDEIN